MERVSNPPLDEQRNKQQNRKIDELRKFYAIIHIIKPNKTEDNKMNAVQKTDSYKTMLKEYPDVLSFGQMCKILSICSKTGYKLLQEEKINNIKIGRAYRIPKIHMIAYLMNGNKKSEKEMAKVVR